MAFNCGKEYFLWVCTLAAEMEKAVEKGCTGWPYKFEIVVD